MSQDLQTAKHKYRKCYTIRKELYGEGNWYTDYALAELRRSAWVMDHDLSNWRQLAEFVDHIENGIYKEINLNLLAAVEGEILCTLLMGSDQFVAPEEYNHYRKIYEKICTKYGNTDNPIINMRLAYNFKGVYFYRCGDYPQAEAAFLDALNEETGVNDLEIITDVQIKSNLLLIYFLENDFPLAYPLIDELFTLIHEDNSENKLPLKDQYRVRCIKLSFDTQMLVEYTDEEWMELESDLFNACQEILSGGSDLPRYASAIAMFILSGIGCVLQNIFNKNIQEKMLRFYFETLQQIDRNTELYSLDLWQSAVLCSMMGILSWNLKLPGAESYFNKCLQISENNQSFPTQARESALQNLGVYLAWNGQYKKGLSYISRALDKLTLIWHSYVRYLNDIRLQQILIPYQIRFNECYTVLRKYDNVENTYERILQFKALASLASRERSRMLRNGVTENELLTQIRALQNELAIASLYSDYEITKTFSEYEQQLRILENDYARLSPQPTAFIDISWDSLQKVIPDNSAVIEYFYCSDFEGIFFENEQESTAIDVYLVCKKNGLCTLKRFIVPNGSCVLGQAVEFVTIIQEANPDQSKALDQLRSSLFRTLLKPVLPEIQGVNTVYIAPNYDLLNLPFGLLYDENEDRTILDNHFSLVTIESARDFLFHAKTSFPFGNSLIIGNPRYLADETLLANADRDFEKTRPLPFTEEEAKRISRYYDNNCYIGTKATKDLFLSARNYRNIHIATHGLFDSEQVDGQDSEIYSLYYPYLSQLLFAGYDDWVITGELSEFYGNGIVTADEISRMDLRSVELVVLSSCMSGQNGITVNRGFQGMVSALSAAGVHYVIANLWSVDDFSTAVFMDKFYYFYYKEHRTPPDAMKKAALYLRQVTMGELKKNRWIEHTVDINKQPFEEASWGGFVCYQCNF